MKNIDEQFIKTVEFLEEKGLIKSRSELATKLGYKQNTFTEILKGRSKVNSYILQSFCKIYNINLNWLFYGEGDMFVDEIPPSQIFSKEEVTFDTDDRLKNLESKLEKILDALSIQNDRAFAVK